MNPPRFLDSVPFRSTIVGCQYCTRLSSDQTAVHSYSWCRPLDAGRALIGVVGATGIDEAPQALGTDVAKANEGYKRRLDLFGPDGKTNLFDLMQYLTAPQALGADCPYGK